MTGTRTTLPKGPTATFLLGHLPQFRRDPLSFLLDLARTHGDIAPFRLGLQKIVHINHPDFIRQVLVSDHDRFEKTGILRRAQSVLGNGLVCADGELHRRQRRLIQPALQRAQLAHYAGHMVESAEQTCGRWRDGQELDVFEEMLHLSLNVVTQSLFSVQLGEADSREFEQALTVVLEHFAVLLTQPKARLRERVPLLGSRAFEQARRVLDEFVFRMIAQRRGQADPPQDLLTRLLRAQEDGQGMSDRQLRDELMTLLTAGHETVATALTWTWYCLARNPAAEAALHEEVDQVLQGRFPTLDDSEKLTYVYQSFAEAMRLYPPVWGMTRKATADVEIGGYKLPAGTVIGMTQFAMHRDPRFFEDPEVFDPMRWTSENRARRPKFSYFPFGGGPRLCIGEPFAWLEGVLVVATIARRWKVSLCSERPAELQPLLTLRPKHGLRARVTARSGSPAAAGEIQHLGGTCRENLC